MYPRNAASPERVEIGPVVLIADGTVQTSGVAVKVIPQGGAEASGGGTVAYSADGVVLYTPTQAETNYTSFVLIASKSGCIPASKTIVTTAESTAGTVRAGTVSDKTGYSLASGGLSAISTWTVAITGNITGNLSGSVVGSVASVTNRVTANTDQWNGVTVTGMPMPTYTQPTGFLAATFPLVVASTANQSTLIDYAGYTLSVLAGAVTGAQTSSETYAIALGGSTYTVAMAGQTSTGTRTAPTLTKS